MMKWLISFYGEEFYKYVVNNFKKKIPAKNEAFKERECLGKGWHPNDVYRFPAKKKNWR